jgi:hypothetical protein
MAVEGVLKLAALERSSCRMHRIDIHLVFVEWLGACGGDCCWKCDMLVLHCIAVHAHQAGVHMWHREAA